MKVAYIAAARPNFMKVDPLLRAFRHYPEFQSLLVHTGQHYHESMSSAFFRDLELQPPDLNLQVGSGSAAWQTAEVMKRLEPVLLDYGADLVIVVGDVNSTLAAALTAARLNIRIAHVEAGLRSFDRTMPEEINRQLTDALADFLFVTEQSGQDNLLREGISKQRIFFVGNVMIDTLRRCQAKVARSTILEEIGIASQGGDHPDNIYAVVTLHRPANVDDPRVFGTLLKTIHELSCELPVFFPVHPRAQERIREFDLGSYFSGNGCRHAHPGLYALPPLGYLDFLKLLSHARIALTDSGGIQEESTALGIPCLTLRDNTERPATVSEGTNQIVGRDPTRILAAAGQVLQNDKKKSSVPRLWDGKAAERIAEILIRQL